VEKYVEVKKCRKEEVEMYVEVKKPGQEEEEECGKEEVGYR
jgi:hypothetical protein